MSVRLVAAEDNTIGGSLAASSLVMPREALSSVQEVVPSTVPLRRFRFFEVLRLFSWGDLRN